MDMFAVRDSDRTVVSAIGTLDDQRDVESSFPHADI
jgi:hypothetical protein